MGVLQGKYYQEQSVFLPENLLREARRQKQVKQNPWFAVLMSRIQWRNRMAILKKERRTEALLLST
jgi:hypothetical protein